MTSQSHITGAFAITDFRFDRAELAWFEKQIWSQLPVSARQTNRALRLGIEDLSMSRQLEVDYAVEARSCALEKLSVHLKDDPSRKPMIALELSHTPVSISSLDRPVLFGGTPSGSAWVQMIDWIKPMAGAGYKYSAIGVQASIDFETIVYKLRQMLIATQSRVAASVSAAPDSLTIRLGLPDAPGWSAKITLNKPTFVQISKEPQALL